MYKCRERRNGPLTAPCQCVHGLFRHPSSGDAYTSKYDVGEANCAEKWRDALGICRPTELIDYHEPHDNNEIGNVVSVFRVLRLFQP